MSMNLGSVGIEITPDLSGFKRDLERGVNRIELNLDVAFDRREIQRDLSMIERALDSVDLGVDIDDRGVIREAQRAITAAQKVVGDVNVGMDVAADAAGELAVEANTAVQVAQRSVRDMVVGVNVSGAQLALSSLMSQASRVASSLLQATALGAGAGAAVAAGGLAVGINSLKDFDAALTESLAIVQDVTPQIRADFEETAQAVAKSTIFGADEAAEAFFFLASAGLDVEQQIASLPAVANFAQAGMFDLALATDIVTDAQSALGLKSADAGKALESLNRIQDVLVKGNILANASVQQFGEALTNRAGAAARALNKDVEETVAVLAAFADQGTKGRRAGEEFARLLGQLGTLAIKNKEDFSELGVEIFDTEGKFRNTADVISEFEGLLGGMSDQQQIATLSQLGLGEELRKTIQLVLGTSDSIRKYESALRDAGGVTEQVAMAQLGSLSAQLSLLGTNVELVLQAFAQPLADRMKAFFAEGGSGFAEFFDTASARAEAAGTYILTQMEKAFEFFRSDEFMAFTVALRDSFSNVVEGVKEFGDEFAQAFGGSRNQSFIESFGDVLVGVTGVLRSVLPVIGRIAGAIAGWVRDNSELVKGLGAVLLVLGGFGLAFKILKTVFSPLTFIIKGLAQVIGLRKALATGADLSIFQRALVFIGGAVKTVAGWFGQAVGFVGRIAGRLLGVIPIIGRVVLFALRFLNPWTAAISLLIIVYNRVEFVRDAVGWVVDRLQDVVHWLGRSIEEAGGFREVLKGLGPFGYAVNGVLTIADAANKAGDEFEGMGKSAASGAALAAGTFARIGDQLIASLARTRQQAADENIMDAIWQDVSGVQVKALQENLAVAEASSEQINKAFRRIGRTAVSSAFRTSLIGHLTGLLGIVDQVRTAINGSLARIGSVEFSVNTLGILSSMFSSMNGMASNMMQVFVMTFKNGFLSVMALARVASQRLVSQLRGTTPAFHNVGRAVIRSFQFGMMLEWAYTEVWLRGRADRIRELKGPISYDRTVLFDAGRAVIGGFQTGLEAAWNPVESWLSRRGHLMKDIVGVDDVMKLSTDILLGKVEDPSKALAGLEPEVPRYWTSFADMMDQAKIIARMFNVVISSSFRDIATNIRVGGAPNSLHTKGQAVDFAGSFGGMDQLATWARSFHKVFAEILWLVSGHFDHVHLGWAKAFNRRQTGGFVVPGQQYIVGETGPEIFTAPARGTIHNRFDSRRMMGRDAAAGASESRTYIVHANGLDVPAVDALLRMRERREMAVRG